MFEAPSGRNNVDMKTAYFILKIKMWLIQSPSNFVLLWIMSNDRDMLSN